MLSLPTGTLSAAILKGTRNNECPPPLLSSLTNTLSLLFSVLSSLLSRLSYLFPVFSLSLCVSVIPIRSYAPANDLSESYVMILELCGKGTEPLTA